MSSSSDEFESSKKSKTIHEDEYEDPEVAFPLGLEHCPFASVEQKIRIKKRTETLENMRIEIQQLANARTNPLRLKQLKEAYQNFKEGKKVGETETNVNEDGEKMMHVNHTKYFGGPEKMISRAINKNYQVPVNQTAHVMWARLLTIFTKYYDIQVMNHFMRQQSTPNENMSLDNQAMSFCYKIPEHHRYSHWIENMFRIPIVLVRRNSSATTTWKANDSPNHDIDFSSGQEYPQAHGQFIFNDFDRENISTESKSLNDFLFHEVRYVNMMELATLAIYSTARPSACFEHKMLPEDDMVSVDEFDIYPDCCKHRFEWTEALRQKFGSNEELARKHLLCNFSEFRTEVFETYFVKEEPIPFCKTRNVYYQAETHAVQDSFHVSDLDEKGVKWYEEVVKFFNPNFEKYFPTHQQVSNWLMDCAKPKQCFSQKTVLLGKSQLSVEEYTEHVMKQFLGESFDEKVCVETSKKESVSTDDIRWAHSLSKINRFQYIRGFVHLTCLCLAENNVSLQKVQLLVLDKHNGVPLLKKWILERRKEQKSVPNVRAWSADMLQSIHDWITKLLQKVECAFHHPSPEAFSAIESLFPKEISLLGKNEQTKIPPQLLQQLPSLGSDDSFPSRWDLLKQMTFADNGCPDLPFIENNRLQFSTGMTMIDPVCSLSHFQNVILSPGGTNEISSRENLVPVCSTRKKKKRSKNLNVADLYGSIHDELNKESKCSMEFYGNTVFSIVAEPIMDARFLHTDDFNKVRVKGQNRISPESNACFEPNVQRPLANNPFHKFFFMMLSIVNGDELNNVPKKHWIELEIFCQRVLLSMETMRFDQTCSMTDDRFVVLDEKSKTLYANQFSMLPNGHQPTQIQAGARALMTIAYACKLASFSRLVDRVERMLSFVPWIQRTTKTFDVNASNDPEDFYSFISSFYSHLALSDQQ